MNTRNTTEISPSQLKAHQIAYYTMLLKESKSDKQKRYLRTQLYNLKKQHNVYLHSGRNLSSFSLRSLQGCTMDGRGISN